MRTAVFLAFASLLTLVGASRPLNPLVPRDPNTATAARAAECAEGLAPAPAPRIDIAEIPLPEPTPVQVASVAPPSEGLRTQLRDAQNAIVRDDRRAFDAALARARTTLADYPPGGERNAAQNVVAVYEDVAVLWDAQFVSPFFGEESAAHRAASAYPGWSEAMRRQVLVDDRDRRFYPARESRQFLAAVAATRLERLGVRTSPVPSIPTRVKEDNPNVALPSVRPRRRPGRVETHTAEEPAPRRATTATTTTTQRRTTTTRRTSPPPTQRAAATKPRAERSTTTRTERSTAARTERSTAPRTERAVAPPPSANRPATPAPATPVPAPEPAPVTTAPGSTAPTSVPDDRTPLATTDTVTTDFAPTTDTVTTAAGTDSSATTMASDTAATATTATAAPATPGRGRSLVVPLILILVGIGVLIVLFRAST